MMKSQNLLLALLCALSAFQLSAMSPCETPPPPCTTGNLTLTLNFDNHPEQTRWSIVDANYVIITAGYGYYTPNVPLTINIPPIGTGDFLLVIHDTGGDGMASGSYELKDGQNTVISGSSFAFSDVHQFCVNNSNNTVLDLTSPTTPGNLTTSNPTAHTVDISFTPSSDNLNLLGYAYFLNGVYSGDIFAAAPPLTVYGLASNTNYDIQIVARDQAGNYSGLSNTSNFTTALLTCGTGNFTLELHLDNLPGETAWEIKDASYNTVAGSSAYTTPNTTVIESIPALANGDYLLVIYDAGGNGISYSNSPVPYTLKDGQGTIISGGRFQYSDVNEFCVGTSNGGGLDLTPPSVPVITASNPTTSTIDVAITVPSTDNHMLIGYIFLINGNYVGDIPSSGSFSGTVPNLSPGTSYSFQIAGRDLAGNFSLLSPISIETTLSLSNSTVFHQGYFETGWDGWIDGGNDCYRYTGNKSPEGTYSIRLRDNSGRRSSMTLKNQDVSSFTEMTIDFQYYIHSFEANEDFWFRYWDGTSWQTIATFQKGVDFTANGLYAGSITMSNVDYNFPTNARFRFQCDASHNNDKVFIDAVVMTGTSVVSNLQPERPSSARIKNMNLVTMNPETTLFYSQSNNIFGQQNEFAPLEFDLNIKENVPNILLYPNPANNYFNLSIQNDAINSISIFDSNGRLVKTLNPMNNNYNIADLHSGVFVVKVSTKDHLNQFLKLVKK